MRTRNELGLRSVSELLNESFFIPAYQRGYRWTRRQVVELLDDIAEFQRDSEEKPKSAFYCLQPVVVKPRVDGWELVDGQQRLTTIRIILGCLKNIVELIGKSPYALAYETRPDSAEYLDDISEELHLENIDFYHMFEASKAVTEWFDERDGAYKIKFLQTLLNNDEVGKNVQVIWYQVAEDIEATAVFTRLNLGKIPLTNADLVKALFLKAANFEEAHRELARLKIAGEWDEMERALQAEDFWYFLSSDTAESNRIELILRLVANDFAAGACTVPKHDPSYIFLMFASWLGNSSAGIEADWARVKKKFMTIKEWYEDRALFHLIGFLVARGEPLANIMDMRERASGKIAFLEVLVERVFTYAFPGSLFTKETDVNVRNKAISEALLEVDYRSAASKKQIVSILLLFNIASLLANNKTNARFQFDRFKAESWDVEHIRSVASEIPQSKSHQKVWLDTTIEYLCGVDRETPSYADEELQKLLLEAKEVQATEPFDSALFEDLFDRINDIFAPDGDEETDHSIGNLALLDRSTNRSYKNAIFPVKRNRIIALDKTAMFVPVCTKNAFLKYYSTRVGNMAFWTKEDSENHCHAVADSLASMLDFEWRSACK